MAPVQKMTFEEAEAYLSSLLRFGIKPGLERVRALCERFGNPQDQFPALHVGGTKGKGSVTMMLSHVLHAAGLRVGTFVKPHIYDVRERVMVDLQPISREDFAALMSEIRPVVEEYGGMGVWGCGGQGSYTAAHTPILPHPHTPTLLGAPTEFEVKTLLMFLHFARAGVDIGVVEVGLGGTYDSTNVLDPLVAVITNVSLDHMDRLGNTVPEIAGQKAGIIKPGRPAVTAARDPEALAVIERAAAEREAPLWRIGHEFDVERHGYGEGWQRFSVPTPVREYRDLEIALAGQFQVENAATAVAALDVMGTFREAVPEEAVRRGLAEVRIAGRMEILRRSPILMIDGAHNAASAQALAAALKELYGDRRLILVLGVLEGHLAADVVAGLAPGAAAVIATAARDPRAQPAEKVAEEARRFTSHVEVVEPVPEAVRRALSLAGPEDVVCVTGSFTVIGEAGRAAL